MAFVLLIIGLSAGYMLGSSLTEPGKLFSIEYRDGYKLVEDALNRTLILVREVLAHLLM